MVYPLRFDYSRASIQDQLLEEASGQGNGEVQISVDAMYHTGEGVTQSYTEATESFSKASDSIGQDTHPYLDSEEVVSELMTLERIAQVRWLAEQ